MSPKRKRRVVLRVSLAIAGAMALTLGITTGLAIASVKNVGNLESVGTQVAALPSQILDVKGRLITEFFSDENRELVTIDELPKHLVYALITREDRRFFDHNGFDAVRTSMAAFDLLRGSYSGGGSTLTQQLAGHLYADRSDFSVTRKLRELWWALQLERHWTKYEILEKYLNTMFFGHGNYGVEAASQYYFGHSARDITIAESALLVIQLANPSLYSPIRRPNEARRMQRTILDQMVELGYTTQSRVDESFEAYWSNYDFTRASTSTAFFEREDRAPFFSEYVRYQLENELLLGSLDINRDGFTVYTTLDLDYQAAADRYMQEGLESANRIYQSNSSRRSTEGNDLVPVIDLLSLAFNIGDFRIGNAKQLQEAKSYYREELNPIVDAVALLFGSDDTEIRDAVQVSYATTELEARRTTVEGALITLENGTGRILAMVGGSRFEARNQFNRAVDASVEPGSSFKPLYYSAAIENKVITPATMIYDSPVVFWNDDGTPYTPQNYRGEWKGPVLVRHALAQSMNVPSLRILERVGFTEALTTTRRLLGIPEEDMVRRNLVRRYPVGLGIVEVAPIEMAKAFATIANQGQEVVPIGIRYIEDRNGRIIMEPEQDLRIEQQRKGQDAQIISPQTAYIMTDMLQTTVESGTLRWAESLVDGFDQPTAGKTGTTQNWADAWTLGFTPYYTTAIWFGFDRGGSNSLGTNQTGAVTAGPVWARYMKEIHEGLEPREFPEPTSGITRVRVTARSGLLPTENYTGRVIEEVFLSGTQPKEFDRLEDFEREQQPVLVDRLRRSITNQNFSLSTGSPELGEDFDRGSFELDFTLDLDPGLSSEDGNRSAEEGNPLLD
ncbi:MAG: penicillin-binding protein 1A [Spirochaetota bacterium]